MPKPFSQDLRNRVIDAVEKGGMSCRAAARRYEVSESTAIKWLERYRRDGLRGPAGHGGHRPSALMPHREFLEAARAEKSDLTLQGLCDRLRSEKGVKADTSMMSRFFRRIGVTLKKRRSSRANKTGRTSAGVGRAGEPISAASIPPASSLSTRPSGQARGQALDQDEHDPPLRLGAEGRAPHRQGPAQPLGDRDLPRRFALRPHRRALPVRRPHQRRALSRLCRTVPRPDAEGRRCRDPRQSRLAQRQGRAEGDPRRRSSPRLPAEILPDLNPIEQLFAKFKTLLRKVGARTYEAISAACGEILKRFPASECAGYLRNAGYA